MASIITSALGNFSQEKFNALLSVRHVALQAVRQFLIAAGYTEVTTSSLVNIAGSCENPYASFTLNYYGREAHLSQSAQLQLEALVIRLQRPVFTVNSSFREEHFDDPDAAGRRLSEFTLIEPEQPYSGLTAQVALEKIITLEEKLIKFVIEKALEQCHTELDTLGAPIEHLHSLNDISFIRLKYDEALRLLNSLRPDHNYTFGTDLGIKEERALLRHFNNRPVFVTHYPAAIKFFNMKRTGDGQRAYNVDLLLPPLGETTGGAVREERGEKIKEYLLASNIAQYLRERGGDPLEPFKEYWKLFDEQPPLLRGGFGIGFERLIGFILNSTDILETISYRTLQPYGR